MAADMYRTMISMPKELEERVLNLRKRDEFKRCSVSEILRTLVSQSLDDHYPVDDTKPA